MRACVPAGGLYQVSGLKTLASTLFQLVGVDGADDMADQVPQPPLRFPAAAARCCGRGILLYPTSLYSPSSTSCASDHYSEG